MPQTATRVPYNPKHWEALKRTFSEPRMSLYTEYAAKKLNAENVDERAFYLCQWNTELCESFYRPLCYLEVALRNALAPVIAAAFEDEDWFMNNPLPERSDQYKKLQEKINFFDGRTESTYPIVDSPAHPILPAGLNEHNIIASVTFGFWVHFFDQRYYSKITSRVTDIFKELPKDYRLVKDIIPEFQNTPTKYVDAGTVSSVIYTRLKKLLELRNEIYHYGTIFEWPLDEIHDKLHELLSWIDADTASLLAERTYFEQIWSRKRELLSDPTL